MKKLAELLKTTPILRTEGATDIEILDVTADSRQVKEGSLFLCLEGAHVDGHKFVDSAVKLGAKAIVASKEVKAAEGVTVVYVADTRKAMEDMVPFFFDYPSRKMRMIALTGTNGKTTTTHVVSHILEQAGYKTGVIGTIHALIGDKELPTHNTTPDYIEHETIKKQIAEEKVTLV
uniref:Mur ligase domain-containing protein n=1 Tax=Dialister sp. TaxID=1955814 RepID=UPI004028AF0D